MEEMFTKSLLWLLPLVIWAWAEVTSSSLRGLDGFSPFLQRAGVYLGVIILLLVNAMLIGGWLIVLIEVVS